MTPNDSTCSLTAGLISETYTKAPNLFAVATACNPATPAPTTRTFAGRVLFIICLLLA